MASEATGSGLNDLLNTEKALSVIIGIFLSVAIAFFFGSVVQFISRLIFTFDYRCRLKWKIGVFRWYLLYGDRLFPIAERRQGSGVHDS